VTATFPFADSMGVDSRELPANPAYYRFVALYATGTDGIEATASEILRFTSARVGVVMIDQTPSLAVWAAGLADVADVEYGAGTQAQVIAGAKARQARGWESTVYATLASADAMTPALKSAGVNMKRLYWGIADWNWSQAQAAAQLAANPSWAFVQWASPQSNPLTLVPGTGGKDLQVLNADLDVASEAFGKQFLLG
jgi:hypothetical protein